jgi:hypothetical protein
MRVRTGRFDSNPQAARKFRRCGYSFMTFRRPAHPALELFAGFGDLLGVENHTRRHEDDQFGSFLAERLAAETPAK